MHDDSNCPYVGEWEQLIAENQRLRRALSDAIEEGGPGVYEVVHAILGGDTPE